MPADFRRVCCSTECCKRQGSEVVQVASVPPRLRHFCRARAVCPLPPSAAPFEAVSSSDELLHPFRSAAACVLPSGPKRTCVHPGGPESASHGVFFPHRGINRRRPLVARFPKPRYGPSSAFRTPTTVYSATGLAGLFRPAATSRVVALQGIVPRRGAAPGFPGPLPSCRWTTSPAVARASAVALSFRAFTPRVECGD
jgi:hypothetical protein